MSDKALLVMDMPGSCEECLFCDSIDYTCGAFRILGKNYTYDCPEDGVADWCPLKPVPEKRKADVIPLSPLLKETLSEYSKGWNACIDKILEGCRNG